MSKLMELVEDYGILRYRLACIGERNHANLAARADERKAEIRTRLEALERDAARYQWLREKVMYDRYGPGLPCGHTKVNPVETDKAIDAAMEADK